MISEETYQEFVVGLLSAPSAQDPVLVAALGLAGEAGEIADLVKKGRFHGHPRYQGDMLNELGDLYFYFIVMLWAMGYTVDEVISENIRKLNERYPDGFEKERSINRG